MNFSEEQSSFLSTRQVMGFTALYCITILAALIGNLLLICIITKKRDTRTLTGFLFVNMAAADLLVTLIVMPVSIEWLYTGGKWLPGILGHVTCTLVYFSFYVTLTASIFSLTLMSVDRYLGVVFPLRRFPRFRRAKVLAAVIWLSSMIYSIPVAVIWRLVEYKPLGIFICTPQFEQLGEFGMEVYYMYLFLFMYLIPLLVISLLYVLVGRTLRHRNIPGQVSTDIEKRNEETKRRIVRMLSIITAAFALCWLPAQCYHLILAFRPDVHNASPPYVMFLCFWSGHANSAVNPWLFMILNDRFRKVLSNAASRAQSSINYITREHYATRRQHANPNRETIL
ncbi:hypothetical protein ACROYT_G033638 [Oculina patagonica]